MPRTARLLTGGGVFRGRLCKVPTRLGSRNGIIVQVFIRVLCVRLLTCCSGLHALARGIRRGRGRRGQGRTARQVRSIHGSASRLECQPHARV
jgi:hypothetical protein